MADDASETSPADLSFATMEQLVAELKGRCAAVILAYVPLVAPTQYAAYVAGGRIMARGLVDYIDEVTRRQAAANETDVDPAEEP